MTQFNIEKEKVAFSYFNHDSGIFFDEKRKRFVEFKDMDQISYYNYNSPFRTYRPDFFGKRSFYFDTELYPIAYLLMNKLYKQRQSEIGRLALLFPNNYNVYIKPLYEHHIKFGELDRYTKPKYLKWDDASITVNYLQYVLNRLGKYGLQWGSLNNSKFPDYKQKLKEEEDKLVDYFLYEMRKEPFEKKEVETMPMN